MRVLLRAGFLALVTSLIVAGAAAAQAPTAAPAKIAYINSAQLLREAPGRAEAEAQFERDAPKLDSSARETRRKSVGQREVEYQTRARGLDSTMQARQAQLVKPIMERVQSVIESIRTEDGYAMIFDVGSQTSVVVAADKKLDLTERVLARLKSQPATPATGAVPQPAGVTRPKR